MHEKITLLESVLGKSILAHRDNVSFHCPFCNHHKPKLNVSLDSGKWGCWVCGDQNDSKGRTVVGLFRKLGASKNELRRAAELWHDSTHSKVSTKKQSCSLPIEYRPLWIPNEKSLFYNKARRYLKSRGITDLDILKYKIGYCVDGRYSDMIILPSYDSNNQLNFYTGRSYLSNPKFKFLAPPEFDKNIICYESTINWNDPVILVESQLNAITIRRNAIPLNGKFIPDCLKERIIDSACGRVTLCLDGDAVVAAMKHAAYFIKNGIDVCLVDLPYDEDANSLGFDRIWELINAAKKITESDIFDYNIKTLLK